MNKSAKPLSQWSGPWIAGTLGTLGLMALLVWALVRLTTPPDITAARAAERRQFLAEIQQQQAQAVEGYAWLDRDKGFVRVPVERAMELVLEEWRDPAAAKAALDARVLKATEPPPPPPEPVNPYE